MRFSLSLTQQMGRPGCDGRREKSRGVPLRDSRGESPLVGLGRRFPSDGIMLPHHRSPGDQTKPSSLPRAAASVLFETSSLPKM
jgi:hypothetical protein